MGCSKYTVFRILDVVLLSAVFIFQSVILSQYTIYSQYHSELPSNYINPIYEKLLWLTGDLVCLGAFLLACFCGFRHVSRQRNKQAAASAAINELNDSPNDGNVRGNRIPEERLHTNSILRYIASARIPLCYTSWFLYASLLILKIVLIFTSDLSKKWRASEANHEKVFFGPQILQVGIGASAVIFSLLVEAHHNAGKEDPRRNAYLKSVSYEVALEILDTACLLSYLITTFDHEEQHASVGEICPAVVLTPPIITLSAVNLLLPSVTLFKLASTNFGETYHVKLEMIYKTLHLLLVDMPFLVIRIHLWNVNDREDVIFIIKNVYGIVGYFRGVYSDDRILRRENKSRDAAKNGTDRDHRINANNRSRRCGSDDAEKPNDSFEMNKLM